MFVKGDGLRFASASMHGPLRVPTCGADLLGYVPSGKTVWHESELMNLHVPTKNNKASEMPTGSIIFWRICFVFFCNLMFLTEPPFSWKNGSGHTDLHIAFCQSHAQQSIGVRQKKSEA